LHRLAPAPVWLPGFSLGCFAIENDRMMVKQIFYFLQQIQTMVLGASATLASSMNSKSLEKTKAFLKPKELFIVNPTPKIDCRINHPVLENLINNNQNTSFAFDNS